MNQAALVIIIIYVQLSLVIYHMYVQVALIDNNAEDDNPVNRAVTAYELLLQER